MKIKPGLKNPYFASRSNLIANLKAKISSING